MAAGVSDSERRTAIAERTRRGLEEDLEDLRETLREDLADFERGVRQLAADPPEWTGLHASQLRAPFDFEHDRLAEAARIGPRVVAVLAGEVEEFVLAWLPAVDGSDERSFAREDVDALIEDGHDLLELLAEIEVRVENAAEQGHVVFDELWEVSLAQLDERRESDINALQDLVGEGELETGPDAQEERANLFEEQRRKADALRDRWGQLHDLLDAGADYTVDGLEDLRAMMRRACQGLAGAYPAVAEREAIEVIFEASDASGESDGSDISETAELSGDSESSEVTESADASESSDDADQSGAAMSETQPAEETPAASDASVDSWLRSEPDGDESEEPVRETSPARRTPEADESGDDKPTEPMITSASELREEGLSEASDLLEESEPRDMRAPPEASDGRETSESRDIHEAETAFALDGGGERSEGDDAVPDGEEADGDEATETSGNISGAGPAGNDDIDGSDDEAVDEQSVDEKAVEGALPDEADLPEVDEPTGSEMDVAEEEESADEELELPDPLEANCIRIRTEWETVGWGALSAALGPPVGFLLGLIVLSLLHLAGVGSAVNPVEAWVWTKPAVAVALVWCLCAPLLMRWHPRWAGWRFQFVREAEIRDDTTLELEDEGFCIDRISFKWEAVQHYRIRRWEAPDDEMVGWLLVVEPAYHDAVTVIAPETNRRRWEQDDGRVLEPPSDAWQIDAKAFDRMTGFLEETASDLP